MLWQVAPLKEFEQLQRQMNDLINRSGYSRTTSFPLFNAHDTKDDLIIVAELPGVKKEDISITVNNGVLTLKGKRSNDGRSGEATLLRSERPKGEFEKELRLPVKINDSNIAASLKEGILTITLPKAEEAKPKQITIEG